MLHTSTRSLSGMKVTLVSVGAVVSAATTAQATFTYVSTPITLDVDGDKWYLNGGSSGTYLLSAGMITTSSTFNLECNPAAVSLDFAHLTSGGRSYITNYTASSSNVIFNGTSPVITMGAYDYQYQLTVGSDSSLSTYDFKNFTNLTPGYVAFSFTSASITYYGWASVTFSTAAHNSLTISSWAYTSDESIYVGQTSSAIPEPAETAGGLGLLALGAVGMRRYLKNRKDKAA